MAILGEIACLSAAIVALPAVVLWRSTRPLDGPPPSPPADVERPAEAPAEPGSVDAQL
jgi:hypothetical protein